MKPGQDRAYRVQEFAEMAGTTVRALHHYDRLGLLKPRRTDAGYRRISPAIWSGWNRSRP